MVSHRRKPARRRKISPARRRKRTATFFKEEKSRRAAMTPRSTKKLVEFEIGTSERQPKENETKKKRDETRRDETNLLTRSSIECWTRLRSSSPTSARMRRAQAKAILAARVVNT